jgi:hypothetical protein
VRLREAVEGLAPGSAGTIVGLYTYTEPVTCLVTFNQQEGRVVRVSPDALELI